MEKNIEIGRIVYDKFGRLLKQNYFEGKYLKRENFKTLLKNKIIGINRCLFQTAMCI